ncbi:MAG: hypothetical protein U0746_16455 [Gemmataceae bacterium]
MKDQLRKTRRQNRRSNRRLPFEIVELERRDVPSGTQLLFDFGTPDSPVSQGYQRVSEKSTFQTTVGFGWLSGGKIQSADTQVGSALTRDYNFGRDAGTFLAQVPAGTYTVTVTLGDPTARSGGRTSVFLEDTLVETVTTQGNQSVSANLHGHRHGRGPITRSKGCWAW